MLGTALGSGDVRGMQGGLGLRGHRFSEGHCQCHLGTATTKETQRIRGTLERSLNTRWGVI